MRNLEAKFRLDNLIDARARAEAIGFSYRATLAQCDTFFATPSGKLKLREETAGASLIYYRRDHDGALELSNYTIVPIADPPRICALLEAALGTIAQVRKRRTLMLRDNIRLHLDEVEKLGEFGEIEAVVPEGEEVETYRPAVTKILAALGVRQGDLTGASYFELTEPLISRNRSVR
jgi:predicted adenylyl cyclase CyaB